MINHAKERAFFLGWIFATGAFVLLSPALYRAMTTNRATAPAVFDDDDAAAIVAAFGPPDEDVLSGRTVDDPAGGMRFMVYRSWDVRILLVKRRIGDPPHPAWKVVGPADAAGRIGLQGEEALRRLKQR